MPLFDSRPSRSRDDIIGAFHIVALDSPETAYGVEGKDRKVALFDKGNNLYYTTISIAKADTQGSMLTHILSNFHTFNVGDVEADVGVVFGAKLVPSNGKGEPTGISNNTMFIFP